MRTRGVWGSRVIMFRRWWDTQKMWKALFRNTPSPVAKGGWRGLAAVSLLGPLPCVHQNVPGCVPSSPLGPLP